MSDQARIVELAIQAAGVADERWADRVTTLVPRVAALFREAHDEADPNSLLNTARKVAEANVFTAEYRGHEFDDNTKRVFVKLFDEKSQGESDYLDENGCQTVRTEPMWSATGRAMKRTLDGLVSGQRAVFYRYTEQIDKKRKMGLLVHLEPLGKPRQAHSAPTQGGPPSEVRENHPSPAPHDPTEDVVLNRFVKLPNRQKIAFRDACIADGIQEFMNPSAEHLDRVLVHLAAVGG